MLRGCTQTLQQCFLTGLDTDKGLSPEDTQAAIPWVVPRAASGPWMGWRLAGGLAAQGGCNAEGCSAFSWSMFLALGVLPQGLQ